jgi:predicted secreted Zn-dependent protease
VDPLDSVDVSRLVASEAFDPYFVTGDNANQIRQNIDQERGMDYDAETDWYVSWQFDDCAGNGLVVTVDVTYKFPEWEPSTSASAELVATWETYTDALFCHEYGHAKHALDCANDVFTALAAIDAGGECGAQQAESEAAFSRILDEYNQLDVQYDADTNHGATMGAVFPP